MTTVESGLPKIPAKSVDLDQLLENLVIGIDRIMLNTGCRLSFDEYTKLYSTVYNYCTSSRPHPLTETDNRRLGHYPTPPPQSEGDIRAGFKLLGSVLYNRIAKYFDQHLRPMMQKSDSLQDVDLLRYYTTEWDRYNAGTKCLDRVFTYFNQSWVRCERKNGVYEVYTLALLRWKASFLDHIQKDNMKLTKALLRLLTQQRNDKAIDQALIKKVLDSFVSLGLDSSKECLDVYCDHFETAFLRTMENYYAESEALLSKDSLSDYLKKVEGYVQTEQVLGEQYLHPNTRMYLVNVLVRVHSKFMLESFHSLLDFEKHEELQCMYALLSRTPDGLEPLRTRFEQYVKNVGLSSILNLVGEGGANSSETVDPRAYVDVLFEAHRKNWETVHRNFNNEAGLVASFGRACRDFVNRNAATGTSSTMSPELIAKHADILLRKNNKMTEDDLEDALNRVVIVFKYLEDKDVFQRFYTSKLSKRLIHGVSMSDESEAGMISKLKEACGFDYTNKMQRMLTDMCLSQDLTESFAKDTSQDHSNIDISFSIKVLGTNLWPLNAPPHGFIIPQEITRAYDRFQNYYRNKHSDKETHLAMELFQKRATDELFEPKLYLDDKLLPDGWISSDVLAQVLAPLVKAKLLVNEEQDRYDLNHSFKSRKIRVNLNLAIKPHTKAEFEAGDSVLKAVDDDRRYVIQATIVRIMKARKNLSNQALIQEVVSQISPRFTPKVTDIKKAIETLLDKEYINRVEDSKDTLVYVA